MKTIALSALAAALFSGCATPPQVTEVGSAVGGSYTNPRTGERYSGQASSYVRFAPKESRLPKLEK